MINNKRLRIEWHNTLTGDTVISYPVRHTIACDGLLYVLYNQFGQPYQYIRSYDIMNIKEVITL